MACGCPTVSSSFPSLPVIKNLIVESVPDKCSTEVNLRSVANVTVW